MIASARASMSGLDSVTAASGESPRWFVHAPSASWTNRSVQKLPSVRQRLSDIAWSGQLETGTPRQLRELR
jgi:hypothetical protein